MDIKKFIKKALKEHKEKDFDKLLYKNKENEEFKEEFEKSIKETYKTKINEEENDKTDDNNEEEGSGIVTYTIFKSDIASLRYPDDFVDEDGRMIKIPSLRYGDPNYFNLYLYFLAIRKKYPDYFKNKIMLQD
jgi:hypothetical protein